jgi:hypothetical protein
MDTTQIVDELELRLRKSPPKHAAIIASRAALRVSPVLVDISTYKTHLDAHAQEMIMLQFLHGCATSWVGSVCDLDISNSRTISHASQRDAILAADQAASLAYQTARSAIIAVESINSAGDAAHAAARAAEASAFATLSIDTIEITLDQVTESVGASNSAMLPIVNAGRIWAEISNDLSILEGGEHIYNLSQRPLWENGIPPQFKKKWMDFSSKMLKFPDNWHVWTNWYEDRINGKNNNRIFIDELEIARINSINKSDLDLGPSHVNALLLNIEEKYRGAYNPNSNGPSDPPDDSGGQNGHNEPEIINRTASDHVEVSKIIVRNPENQNPPTAQFTDDGARITTDLFRNGDEIATDPISTDLHAEALRMARRLSGVAEQLGTAGSNRPSDLQEVADAVVEALGAEPAEVRAGLLAIRALDLDHKIVEDESRRTDTHAMEESLDPEPRRALEVAAGAVRTYLKNDPFLAALYARHREPSDATFETATAELIVDDAVLEDAATSEARDVVVATHAIKDSQFSLRSYLNFGRAGLKLTAHGLTSFGANAVGLPKAAKWLLKNEAAIIKWYENDPETQKMAQSIIDRAKIWADKPNDGSDDE